MELAQIETFWFLSQIGRHRSNRNYWHGSNRNVWHKASEISGTIRTEIANCADLFSDYNKIISELIMRLERLETRVIELERENVELRERLSGYENPKNSRNSSIPPSRDENRPKKNQSLRRTTGRKPGGQPGNKGNTLKMNPDPDHVVELSP